MGNICGQDTKDLREGERDLIQDRNREIPLDKVSKIDAVPDCHSDNKKAAIVEFPADLKLKLDQLKRKSQGKGPTKFRSESAYYDGEWIDGEFGGYGEFTDITIDLLSYPYKSCVHSCGNFANGKLNGLGYTVDKNGNWWFGQWANGKKTDGIQGHNKCCQQDYRGTFDSKGEYHGKGKCLNLRTGDTYDGDWQVGRKHGVARETWKNGNHYYGDYYNGKMQGYGVMTWKRPGKTDKVYHGQWKNALQDGLGKMVWNGKEEFRQYKAGVKVSSKTKEQLRSENLDWNRQLSVAFQGMGQTTVDLRALFTAQEIEAISKKHEEDRQRQRYVQPQVSQYNVNAQPALQPNINVQTAQVRNV